MSECKDSSLEVSAPGGWRARIFGVNGLQLAVLVLVGYFLWQGVAEHSNLAAELTAQRKELIEQRKEMAIQTWMLSLPADQRPQLIMPPGVEQRIYSNERRR